jgi:aminoglycoside phosphotransferase (APT) family kinase protein
VAADPAPFVSLGLASPEWLERAMPVLLDSARRAAVDGTSLVHDDVRSDNIFLQERGTALLVDWSHAAIGNEALDLAGWLPSLHAEGGPAPRSLAPSVPPELAALVAGYFAAHAGLPDIPTAPRVRTVQLLQLRVALPWAAELHDLPPPV